MNKMVYKGRYITIGIKSIILYVQAVKIVNIRKNLPTLLSNNFENPKSRPEINCDINRRYEIILGTFPSLEWLKPMGIFTKLLVLTSMSFVKLLKHIFNMLLLSSDTIPKLNISWLTLQRKRNSHFFGINSTKIRKHVLMTIEKPLLRRDIRQIISHIR